MEKLILIKYGELTTKKANRNLFINTLFKNISDKLKKYDVKIIKNRVRMFISVDNKYLDLVIDSLKDIFGIHSIVIVYKVNNNIEDIKNKVLETMQEIDFKTFKVETKRSDKNYPISSVEMNSILGGFLLGNLCEKHVDVHTPDYVLKLEIREDYTYIYSKEIMGLGGYPVSVLGKGLVMLSGGIDSPVCGYLALKRGVKIEAIYFESPPHTSIMAKNKVKKLVAKLARYGGSIKLHVIPFTKIQEAIFQNDDTSYMITIMRRMMYRISEKVAKKNKCLAIFNGESIGQVASQTLTSMGVINEVTSFPIIKPLACFDKEEIIKIAKNIDTYDTSILPYEDCCTIFLPKHPVINPKLDVALKLENKFNYEELIQEAINNMETIIIDEDL